MIDYRSIEVELLITEARALAVNALMGGRTHMEIKEEVARYLRQYLDPERWTWHVFTPWKNNVLTSWDYKSVRVVIEARSAVEQLARLSDATG